mmetsp:Transcript_43605/g.113594  ORF Transcript_43605/g.113594 Transcript_43605/m.113594 type:complete len:86 (+) Transcript_43605:553-810(+)
MRRIQRGPVRGISLKLQEEERERRMDFVPDESDVKIDNIKIDPETREMLKEIGLSTLPNIQVEAMSGFDRRPRGPRKERTNQNQN